MHGLVVVCQLLFNHVSMTSVLPLPSGCSRSSDDDIELLTYNVYFHIRNFREADAFTAHLPSPNQTRSWNERSVHVSGVTQQQFVVAYVVAVSARGTGAVAAEQSYGVTFGNGEWRVWERWL